MDDFWSSLPLPGLCDDQLHWLFAPGSLTLRLKALGQFGLEVAGQRAALPTQGEAQALGMPPGSLVWVREVGLTVDGQVMVCARSLTPIHNDLPAWPELAGYGNQPLGSLLYTSTTIHRGAFECQRPPGDSPLSRLARSLGQPGMGLLARRSRFTRDDQPLLIAECFVPGFWKRLQETGAPLKLAI